MKTPRAAKRPRTKRVKGRPVVATARDILILSFIGLCGYVAIEQIAREFFRGLDRCRRRMRRLYDDGYVVIALRTSTAPNLFSLTARGVALVAGREPALVDRLRRQGAIRLAGVPHHLAIVDTRLFAATWGEAQGTPLLRWESAQGELARDLDLKRFHLEPDALAEFAGAASSSYLFVEVDRGTETLQTLERKLARHREAFASRALDALWIVVGAGAKRRAAITGLAEQAGIEAWTSVMDLATVLARPIERAAGGARDLDGPKALIRGTR